MNFLIWAISFFIFISIHSVSYSMEAGKLIITGFRGQYPTDYSIQQLKRYIDHNKIGGIILYGRNIKNKQQLTSLLSYLTSDTSIIVAIDHEGGLVQRLQDESFNLNTPSPKEFCSLSQSKQIEHAQTAASTLKGIGVNVNFGGVLDMPPLIQPSSICKDFRCHSDKPLQISNCNNVYISAHKQHKLLFTLKHFPGHGPTNIDSHLSLPNITRNHSHEDYMPYFILQNNNRLDMVMMGHLLDESVDSEFPASLSKKHIQYLRQVIGFKGLIITDDLNMKAILNRYSSPSIISSHAINAGNNLLLFEYLSFQSIDTINKTLSKLIQTTPSINHHIKDSLVKLEDYLQTL